MLNVYQDTRNRCTQVKMQALRTGCLPCPDYPAGLLLFGLMENDPTQALQLAGRPEFRNLPLPSIHT